MILVGLTGGLATGKSTVARLFQDCGARVIHADDLARQAVQPGKPAWKDIVRTFGTGVIHADRSLNRDALAKIVFRNPTKLRRLNAIVHPRVAREQARLTKTIAAKHPQAVVVYDVPLLFEAGVDKRVDKILVVTADRQTQIQRLIARNGLTRTEALRRIRAQMPLSRKIPLADVVLDGTLPLAQLRREIGRMYRAWRRSA
ncbi:MAG: dephospho-CoA kinase [Nitrospirae bacterium]|nr:MAG: dephospho-CoA kinase [Nitrospirota bacterium]